jgi:glyoxylase-like metal-dependent hydrolase (beta-lactamase superfamily II)
MARLSMACVAVLITLTLAGFQSQRQPAGPAGTSHQGKAFRFNKVAEGVYHAVGTGSLAVVGNSSIIVNDDDAILVDDHVSPAAAWVLLDELKDITNKPVRTVVNTHFHYDHAHGNQVFDKFQAYLRDVWTEISRLKQQGVSAEDAAKRADLTRHKDHFPIQGPGVPLIAVNRIYDLIDRR